MKSVLRYFVMAAIAAFVGGCSARTLPEPTTGPVAETQPSATQVEAARQLGRPAIIANSIDMKLILIPAGEFLMGSSESAEELAQAFKRKVSEVPWFQYERPQHKVRITKPFYLGIHEVTQEEYECVMGTNPSGLRGPGRPVDGVSWDDAVTFCNRLSALPEEKTAGRIYRLPTEAEWEYACGGGTTSRYSFGDDPGGLKDHAWFEGNASATSHPVGQKRPNAWGVSDMHGNVWEWCADWYDEGYYANSPADDPAGPSEGRERVVRGGSWNSARALCGTKNRFGSRPRSLSYDRGFRVVAVHVDEVGTPLDQSARDGALPGESGRHE